MQGAVASRADCGLPAHCKAARLQEAPLALCYHPKFAGLQGLYVVIQSRVLHHPIARCDADMLYNSVYTCKNLTSTRNHAGQGQKQGESG